MNDAAYREGYWLGHGGLAKIWGLAALFAVWLGGGAWGTVQALAPEMRDADAGVDVADTDVDADTGVADTETEADADADTDADAGVVADDIDDDAGVAADDIDDDGTDVDHLRPFSLDTPTGPTAASLTPTPHVPASHEPSVRVAQADEEPKPYGRGDMELSLGLGFGGYAGAFSLGIGADFAYYVVSRLAPGLEVYYQATWGDVSYPQALRVFPFLKFVLIRSYSFAPYILVGGGRHFEWGGATESFTGMTFNGYVAVNAWLVGVGGGAVTMMSEHLGLKVQALAMYERYDKDVYDWDRGKDIRYRWLPAISLGLVFAF